MHNIIRAFIRSMAVMALGFTPIVATGQTPAGIALEFIPAQPTSADTIYLKIPRSCSSSNYLGAGYRTSATGGKIRVDILLGPPPPCPFPTPAAPALLVEIGRLPPGAYALDLIEARLTSFEVTFATIASNAQFTVTDHRAAKTAPAGRLNYSDHWWDANNSGTGIFIWQDARDQLLAAWFTYGTDGKAAWYTVQAGTWTSATRYEGKLVQTSRAPNTVQGGLVDVVGPTSLQFVGTASLDFSTDDGALAGVFTYKFDNAAASQSRNILRFNK